MKRGILGREVRVFRADESTVLQSGFSNRRAGLFIVKIPESDRREIGERITIVLSVRGKIAKKA